MSKISSKNLFYDKSLPPFLARLQEAKFSSEGSKKYNVSRVQKIRKLDEEIEDEPFYFDEKTRESLTKKEWEIKEALHQISPDGKKISQEVDVAPENEEKKVKLTRNIVALGVRKKRKITKHIGTEQDENFRDNPQIQIPYTGKIDKTRVGMLNTKCKSKGVKRMKLSFD